MTDKIGVKTLKGVGVLCEDDIYDLACLLLRVDDAKDRGRNHRSRYTVYGLATTYSMITAVNRDKIIANLERDGLPLGATVEHDKDVS